MKPTIVDRPASNEYANLHENYFLPDVFLCFTSTNWENYLSAVRHFLGWNPEPGEIIVTTGQLKRSNRPSLPQDEEYNLLLSLLTDQHERTHYFQLSSTAFGIYMFIHQALHWDFMKELTGQLYLHQTTNIKSNPKLPLLAESQSIGKTGSEYDGALDFGQTLPQLFDHHGNLFDNANITKYHAVRAWNGFVDYLDTLGKQPGDNVVFRRFSEPVDKVVLANPEGISLLALIESSARAQDMSFIAALNIREELLYRFVGDFCNGPYISLIDRVKEVVDGPLAIELVIRLAGIALQTPMTSLHSPIDTTKRNSLWEDYSPTWRFARLLEEIQTARVSAKKLIEDPNEPDRVCEKMGWPTISETKQYFLSTKKYGGTNRIFSDVLGRHQRFCEFSLSSSKKPFWMKFSLSSSRKPVWMMDVLRSKHSQDIRYSKDAYPPWQFAGGELVTHATLKSGELIENCWAYLTSVAAREMLSMRDLPKTKKILRAVARWSLENGVESDWVWQSWAKTFELTFHFRPEDVGIDFSDS